MERNYNGLVLMLISTRVMHYMTEVIILSFPGVSFPEGGMGGGEHLGGLIYPTLCPGTVTM